MVNKRFLRVYYSTNALLSMVSSLSIPYHTPGGALGRFWTPWLILLDEFIVNQIDNQIDNLAITKAETQPIPWMALKRVLGVAQPGLETYQWI